MLVSCLSRIVQHPVQGKLLYIPRHSFRSLHQNRKFRMDANGRSLVELHTCLGSHVAPNKRHPGLLQPCRRLEQGRGEGVLEFRPPGELLVAAEPVRSARKRLSGMVQLGFGVLKIAVRGWCVLVGEEDPRADQPDGFHTA